MLTVVNIKRKRLQLRLEQMLASFFWSRNRSSAVDIRRIFISFHHISELLDYIFADLRNRSDMALGWIYQEYANYQGYNIAAAMAEKPSIASYDSCLTRLLGGLLERPEKEG